jgi:hypothetical protein
MQSQWQQSYRMWLMPKLRMLTSMRRFVRAELCSNIRKLIAQLFETLCPLRGADGVSCHGSARIRKVRFEEKNIPKCVLGHSASI